MNTNIEALKALYVEMGGSAETVADITIIPDMLNALAQIATPFISAADNGKVVVDGALVAQTAHADVTENGTLDTTTNNSVKVAVPNPNSVVTVTGTAAAPFGSIDPAELHTAITSNNATALMTVDATAIGVSDTLYLFAQPAASTHLDFQAVGGMSNSGCSCADASYSKTTGDLIAVAALTQGVYSLLTDYAALLTTTLTVIYHPLPTV